MRNQRTGEQEIARRRNEVACLIPEVGQPQQRRMRDEQEGKDERIGEEVFAQTALLRTAALKGRAFRRAKTSRK